MGARLSEVPSSSDRRMTQVRSSIKILVSLERWLVVSTQESKDFALGLGSFWHELSVDCSDDDLAAAVRAGLACDLEPNSSTLEQQSQSWQKVEDSFGVGSYIQVPTVTVGHFLLRTATNPDGIRWVVVGSAPYDKDGTLTRLRFDTQPGITDFEYMPSDTELAAAIRDAIGATIKAERKAGNL